MVIDFLIGAIVNGITFFLDNAFNFDIFNINYPDFNSIWGDILNSMSLLSQLNSWIPFGAITTAIGIVLASAFAHITIKITRIVLSYLTLGGGNA